MWDEWGWPRRGRACAPYVGVANDPHRTRPRESAIDGHNARTACPLPPDIRVIPSRSIVGVVRCATGRTELGEGDRCVGQRWVRIRLRRTPSRCALQSPRKCDGSRREILQPAEPSSHSGADIESPGSGSTEPDGGSGAMASAPSPSVSRLTTRTEPTAAARPLCASGNRVVNCPGTPALAIASIRYRSGARRLWRTCERRDRERRGSFRVDADSHDGTVQGLAWRRTASSARPQ